MARKRVLSREEILRLLDLDENEGDADWEPVSDEESDENSEEEGENVVDVPVVPSTSNGSEQSRSCRSRGVRRSVRNRSRTAGVRGRGRGVTDNNGWLEPGSDFGEINETDIPNYTGVSGMKVPLPTDRTPLGYYELFIDCDIIERFVLETNKFARQVKERLPDFYYLKLWDCDTGTNATEIRKMIGLLMAMGIISKPTERMYWSTHPVLETPFFSKVCQGYILS